MAFSALTPVNPLFTQWPQNNALPSSHPYGGKANSVTQTRISTPDLTTSPTSSTSSISMTSDERWSMPSADFPPRPPSCADLNPYAQPFVPGSFLMHNPILSKDQLDAQLLASIPVDYLADTADGLPDFKLAPLSDWDTFSEEPLEFIEREAHSPSTPTYPPGPPGPPIPPTRLLKELPPQAVPPSYLPLIAECLRFSTEDHEIESYSRVIVISRSRWDLESLLELCERICFEMYNPCTKPTDKDGHVITACDCARYIPMNATRSSSNGFLVEYERGTQRQRAIAIMVKHLRQHISIIQSAEAAQMFMWNLRETVLTRFREVWDIENLRGKAMSLSKPATPYDVRCALTLCKSIASFFNQDLIIHQHITMCINILLKHLMSVEHVEALALLVLGCGPAFWDASNADSHRDSRYTTNIIGDFLGALFASVANFSLHDSKSLVFPHEVWGEGQLMARLKQVEVALKSWEILLSGSSKNIQDSMVIRHHFM